MLESFLFHPWPFVMGEISFMLMDAKNTLFSHYTRQYILCINEFMTHTCHSISYTFSSKLIEYDQIVKVTFLTSEYIHPPHSPEKISFPSGIFWVKWMCIECSFSIEGNTSEVRTPCLTFVSLYAHVLSAIICSLFSTIQAVWKNVSTIGTILLYKLFPSQTNHAVFCFFFLLRLLANRNTSSL